MNKIFSKILMSFIIIMTFFLFKNPVMAVDSSFLYDDGGTFTDRYCCFGTGDFYYHFIATHNNLSKIEVKYPTFYGNIPSWADIYDKDGNFLMRSTQTDQNGWQILEFSHPVYTPIGDYFYIYFMGNDPIGSSNGAGCISTDVNPLWKHTSSGGTWNSCFASRLYYDDTYIAPTGSWNINASYPLTGMTFASSSVNFIVDYTIPSYKFGLVSIWLQENDNDYHLIGTKTDGSSTGTTTGQFIFKSSLIDANYNWYGSIMDYDTMSEIASSSIENFTVNAFGTPTFTPPLGLTEDDICVGVATSTIMGGIECAFKKVAMWVFWPSQTSVDGLYKSYGDLKESFPFNAFFGLTTALTDAIATTTLSTSENIAMPWITATGTFYMLPVITSSSIPNLIGNDNYNLFRSSISFLLWLLVAFLIFLQFKNI